MDQEEKSTAQAKANELINEPIIEDSNAAEEEWESDAGELEMPGPVAGTSRSVNLGTRGGKMQVTTEKITTVAELRKFAGLNVSKQRTEVSVVSMVGGAGSRKRGQRKTLAQKRAEMEEFKTAWRAEKLRKKREAAQKRREAKRDLNREADAIIKNNEDLIKQLQDKLVSLTIENKRQKEEILQKLAKKEQ